MPEPIGDIYRITTPLPFRPRAVHAYLVPLEGGGWMLVDGGLGTDEAWRALAAGVEEVASWRDLRLHVVTHMHLDHMGLVQRIRDASSVPVAMGRLDSERAAHAAAEPEEEDGYRASLLRAFGAPGPVREELEAMSRRGRRLAPFVPPDHELPTAGGPLPIAHEWVSVWTPGHTAGHVSLFRRSDRVLIAGDAVLPTISPTIGVNRQSTDPVEDYLGALDRIEALDPAVILPGHGEVIHGRERVKALRVELLREADRLLELVDEIPRTPWEIAAERYRGRDLPIPLRVQASRESLAHLERLVRIGEVVRSTEAGITRFHRSSRTIAGGAAAKLATAPDRG